MPGVKGRSGGRNARTRAALERAGTFRADRHDGIENPPALPGPPRPPGKLGPIARREWRRMVSLLEEQNQLCREIAGALYQYCQLFEESEEIKAQRDERAKTIELIQESMADLDSDQKLLAIENITKLLTLDSKDATQIRQYRLALRIFLVEFGLTPAARSRVKQIDESKKPQPQSNIANLQDRARQIRAIK